MDVPDLELRQLWSWRPPLQDLHWGVKDDCDTPSAILDLERHLCDFGGRGQDAWDSWGTDALGTACAFTHITSDS